MDHAVERQEYRRTTGTVKLIHHPFRALWMGLLACPVAGAAGQAPRASYAERGARTETHRTTLQAQIQTARQVIGDTLRIAAPDLLVHLDPTPPLVARGYGLLPRITGDAPARSAGALVLSTYTWDLTDSLITQGRRRADSISSILARPAKDRALYERLVSDFNALVAHRRFIDSHVEHNWFWQARISGDTGPYRQSNDAIRDALARRDSTVRPASGMPAVAIQLDESNPRRVDITLPIVTDIADSAFLTAFQSAVESHWRLRNNGKDLRLLLTIRRIAPRALYCRDNPDPCSAPITGSAIDLNDHLGRFPKGLALLTTGATQPYVTGGSALILGPRDVTPRTLAHEVGHLLGFPDGYFRGYRNDGLDGFAILELVPDMTDLMSSPGSGSVHPRHFSELASNIRADHSMKAGLDALYRSRNAKRAVVEFRTVLANRPTHYGATFQLAKALDAAGDSVAAMEIWRRTLRLAEAINDTSSARIARARLRRPPRYP